MKTFKVLQSNPNQKGGFVTKLQCEEIVADAIFGDKKRTVTYYISAPKQLAINQEISEDKIFPKYKVVEHKMINPETNEEFMGKWLHLA
jgi:hypothetical protein